ncbi:YEATS domain-containing protein 4 [Phakopsora pachyrhizi]|uniref:Protein AF-9 homolog n=1 Tax=Phakopsora pachyrhizi TaxID=170000 RepID=A0AAV0AFS2_PHAPC|nr:YEATS domain-containing protein 4 [Phakopsora pachyrhizi]
MIPVEERIANPDHNMRWTVALRSATSLPLDSDILKQRSIEGDIIGGADNLLHFIKKVSFKIHNSYPNPLRMIDRAPYEINETGWGEFLIHIKMKDYNQPEQSERASPGDLNSIKTLVNQHQSSTALKIRSNPLSPNSSKLIHLWQYNEIVFTEPNETFYHRLLSNPMTSLPIKNQFPKHLFSLEIKEKEFKKPSLAKMKVLIETNQLRGALVRSERELNETKRFI